jgi:ribosomal protein S18 acetylase RimI-like enzyme
MEEYENTIQYKEAETFSPEVANAVKRLVVQLDDNYQPLSDEDIKTIIHSPVTHLILATDVKTQEIVGMITVIIYRIPYKVKGWLEDVVVDEAHRKKGIGKSLLLAGIALAKEKNVKTLDLTSRPSRESANNLYLLLGFEKRDTNVYRMNLA